MRDTALEDEPASDGDAEIESLDDDEGSESEAEPQVQDEESALVHLASNGNLDSCLLTLYVWDLGRHCLLRRLLCVRSPQNHWKSRMAMTIVMNPAAQQRSFLAKY